MKVMDENEIRNMASSNINVFRSPEPIWTSWTVKKSVKEGYEACGWVYRAVSMVAKNGASVPWQVKNVQTGEVEPNHHISLLLNKPCKSFSRLDMFELLLTWQQLAGKGFLHKVKNQGLTKELYPISPDRLGAVESKKAGELISGYEIIDCNGKRNTSPLFTTETVIPFRLIDPSNPIEGISPLKAAAKAVDVDIEQQNWNKSAMQNRGVLDGIFTFDRDLDPTTFDTYREKLKEIFGGHKSARGPGVIGSNAKYQQLSLSPAEMDFLNSRKFNREEIFIIFGVPPQLAGVQDSSTFNNYIVSRRILWEATVIPYLFDLSDTLNMSFYEELGEGKYIISPNLSNVAALKDNEDEVAKTAKVYFSMGVPVSIISEKFNLNIPKYEGSELPWGGAKPNLSNNDSKTEDDSNDSSDRSRFKLATEEQRDIQEEIDEKESLSQDVAKTSIQAILDLQQEAVFKSLDDSEDTQAAIVNTREEFTSTMQAVFLTAANIFAGSVLVDERNRIVNFQKRAFDPLIEASILEFMNNEAWILTEISMIDAFTAETIISTIIDAEREGMTIDSIKSSIIDTGLFSSERALRIARTTVGSAQSVGQSIAARSVGATKKIWHDSNFEVREEHTNRDNEVVGIDETFSSQFANSQSPRWPLDQNIDPADRINCRCSMTFTT